MATDWLMVDGRPKSALLKAVIAKKKLGESDAKIGEYIDRYTGGVTVDDLHLFRVHPQMQSEYARLVAKVARQCTSSNKCQLVTGNVREDTLVDVTNAILVIMKMTAQMQAIGRDL